MKTTSLRDNIIGKHNAPSVLSTVGVASPVVVVVVGVVVAIAP